MRKQRILAAGSAVFMCGMIAGAHAQDYPVDTVTLITHSSPGGGSDVFLRELSRYLGPILGANVVVENVRGGSGAAAMANLAQSAPDGSKFYATTPTFIYTSLLSDPEYKYTDLEPLVNFFIDPEVIYTSANSEYQTLEDVIDHAREGRGQWGAANPASLERQALEQLKAAAGVNAAVVTHEGGGDLLINVLNGTLQIGVGEVQEIQSQLEAGELRLLATFSDERLEAFPDLPTVEELGYDVVVRKFRGLAGPKDLPVDVIAAWERAVQEVLADEEYKAAYEAANLRAAYMPHEEYVQFIEDFGNETRDFLKETGVIE
ncbi:Bug family tripartite tricarboxylate transporter substrate binding protein [Chelativorans xinjiangense]|uniref:Bug family tripartite tricarboxylate transporter substrate binding protein n=1 Tax=Chelativorans xinjiangense TaxID=2681485 RepID=UPI00135C41DB|nr:tripartite tricarboxylate transporter substrate binding protein [Chelativorans xinjiangense]